MVISNSQLSQYRSTLESDLEHSGLTKIACSIFDYLIEPRNRAKDYLPFTRFRKILNQQSTQLDKDILDVLTYFCGERVNILTPKFEFIDDEGESFPLSNSEALEAYQTHEFYHPETGKKIDKPASSIFLYYATSKNLRELESGN